MSKVRILCGRLMLSAALLAAGGAGAEDTLRPEIGKPMLAAQDLLKAHKYKEALARIAEADAVPARTAYEGYIIERMRAAAASGLGDNATAAKAFEAVINTGRLPAAEQLKMMEALAGTYYRAQDYAKTVDWIRQYQKGGGSSPQLAALMIQAQYMAGDYAGAAKEAAEAVAADEQAGRVPAETMLQMLANCQHKTKDYAGYVVTLEKLLKYHPKQEYWADIFARLQSKPGFPDRLLLDVYRLRHASGNLKEANAYVEYAQIALQDGLPGEARRIVAEGFNRKLLGVGPDAARHNRLRDMAERQTAEDRANLATRKRQVDKDPNGLVNDGNAYVSQGEFDKGIALIEQGVGSQALKRQDEAALHLGLAYLQAGNKAKAAHALNGVSRKGGGIGDLARLWIILAALD